LVIDNIPVPVRIVQQERTINLECVVIPFEVVPNFNFRLLSISNQPENRQNGKKDWPDSCRHKITGNGWQLPKGGNFPACRQTGKHFTVNQSQTLLDAQSLNLALHCHRSTEPPLLQNGCYRLPFSFVEIWS